MSDETKDWGCLLRGGGAPSLLLELFSRPGFVEKWHGDKILVATSLGNDEPKNLPLDVRIWAAIMMLREL